MKRIELGSNSASKARTHFRCLLFRIILGSVGWMIPAPSGFATNFSNTVTAGPGQTVTLNPGDTVTVLGANGEGIVATGTGTLSASGVTVTTHGNNGSGAAAHAGGRLSITSTSSNHSTVTTSGIGSFRLLSSGLGSSLLADGVTLLRPARHLS